MSQFEQFYKERKTLEDAKAAEVGQLQSDLAESEKQRILAVEAVSYNNLGYRVKCWSMELHFFQKDIMDRFLSDYAPEVPLGPGEAPGRLDFEKLMADVTKGVTKKMEACRIDLEKKMKPVIDQKVKEAEGAAAVKAVEMHEIRVRKETALFERIASLKRDNKVQYFPLLMWSEIYYV